MGQFYNLKQGGKLYKKKVRSLLLKKETHTCENRIIGEKYNQAALNSLRMNLFFLQSCSLCKAGGPNAKWNYNYTVQ